MYLRFTLICVFMLTGCVHIKAWLSMDEQETMAHGKQPLSSSVEPTDYALSFDIDPRHARYSGVVDVGINLKSSRSTIDLHGENLTVEDAYLVRGDMRVKAKVHYGPNGALRLVLDTVVGPGPARLNLSYSGALTQNGRGFFRVKDDGRWYLFSQLAPSLARQAFPCFDQPNFKTPFRVRLKVPKGMQGFGNAPIQKKVSSANSIAIEFKATKPLPTYLLAIAVGDFDLLNPPAQLTSDMPVRLLAVRGKAALGHFALKSLPTLYAHLKEYVGIAYPFEKLDLVAVPQVLEGAMEHPGLVTFRETLLLMDEERAPPDRRLWGVLALAHELAHSYFGNLVTPLNWNELWLSEALSTWMARQLLEKTRPEMGVHLSRVAGTNRLMRFDIEDAMPPIKSSQPRQDRELVTDTGVEHAKGAAVLHMIHHWLTANVFRNGLRSFLKRNAHGTGTTQNLVNALDPQGKKKIDDILKDFLGRPSFPLLKVAFNCPSTGTPEVVFEQVISSVARPPKPNFKPWTVPLCYRYGHREKTYRDCFLMSSIQASQPLQSKACPDWFHGNADNTGYYQWYSKETSVLQLIGQYRDKLTPIERAALPESLLTLLELGALSMAGYTQSLIEQTSLNDRIVLEGVITGLTHLTALNRTEQERRQYASFVRSILKRHLDRLGFEAAADESAADTLLRPLVLFPLAFIGHDTDILRWARDKTNQYLSNPSTVSPDVLTAVLPMAARQGDDALWDALAKRLTSTKNPVTRIAILGALGSFEDARLLTRTLELFLNTPMSHQDFISVIRGVSPAVRDHAWMWMTRHYDELTGRLIDVRDVLPWLAQGFCTANDRERVKQFFSTPDKRTALAKRHLNQVIKSIDRCIRFRARSAVPFRQWLNQWTTEQKAQPTNTSGASRADDSIENNGKK